MAACSTCSTAIATLDPWQYKLRASAILLLDVVLKNVQPSGEPEDEVVSGVLSKAADVANAKRRAAREAKAREEAEQARAEKEAIAAANKAEKDAVKAAEEAAKAVASVGERAAAVTVDRSRARTVRYPRIALHIDLCPPSRVAFSDSMGCGCSTGCNSTVASPRVGGERTVDCSTFVGPSPSRLCGRSYGSPCRRPAAGPPAVEAATAAAAALRVAVASVAASAEASRQLHHRHFRSSLPSGCFCICRDACFRCPTARTSDRNRNYHHPAC